MILKIKSEVQTILINLAGKKVGISHSDKGITCACVQNLTLLPIPASYKAHTETQEATTLPATMQS